MNLPIIIGKESNDDILQVDLIYLPHLFVSYSEKEHINLFLKDVLNTITHTVSSAKIQFACAISGELYSVLNIYLKDTNLLALFIRNEETDPARGSKYLFMRTLMKELKRRQKIRKTQGKSSAGKFNPLIVIIDDIFEIIITKRKYTGTYFLELLAAGKELEIYFIAASVWTYRNLLSQLIKSKLHVKKGIGKQVPEKSFLSIQPLVAELVITPDDLYFYKLSNQMDYTRYFPIREGLAHEG